MKVYLRLLIVLATLAAGAMSARAGTFDFSYVFDTGQKVTGSFSGTDAGGLVTDISAISVLIDGVAFAGPLKAWLYTDPGGQCGTCYANSGAYASFDPLKNNFFFANSVPPESQSTGSNWFYIIPFPHGIQSPASTSAFVNGAFIDYYNGSFIPANWVLTAVPEISTMPMVLAGLLCIGIIRRRKAFDASIH